MIQFLMEWMRSNETKNVPIYCYKNVAKDNL